MSLTCASIYCLHLKMTRYTNFLSLQYDDLNRSVTFMRNNMFVILIIMMIITLSGTNVSFGHCMFVRDDDENIQSKNAPLRVHRMN